MEIAMTDEWTTKPIYTQCRHREVAFQTKNVSFKNDTLHYLELFGFCTQCQKHVIFVGIPTGKVLFAPSMTEDGVMIRLPFCCDGDKLAI